MWVLRTEPGSLGREVSALSLWAANPTLFTRSMVKTMGRQTSAWWWLKNFQIHDAEWHPYCRSQRKEEWEFHSVSLQPHTPWSPCFRRRERNAGKGMYNSYIHYTGENVLSTVDFWWPESSLRSASLLKEMRTVPGSPLQSHRQSSCRWAELEWCRIWHSNL